MSEYKLLIVPGLGGSGEDHWQTYWCNTLKNTDRVEQDNWDTPSKDLWVQRLNEHINKSDEQIILIAHSLAVSLVLHWLLIYENTNIKGVMLVAPADVDSPSHTPDVVRSFAPMPLQKIKIPSIVVCSENDNYISIERARFFANKWESKFVSVGKLGHINSESQLGIWEEGQKILANLIKKITS